MSVVQGCDFCTVPGGREMCRVCALAYDRWQRSEANDGTHISLMHWVARRVRRFTRMHKKKPRA